MKGKSFIFLLTVIFFSVISFSELNASGNLEAKGGTRLYSQLELELLEKKADSLSRKLQMDVVIAAIPDFKADNAGEYITDVYRRNNESFGKYKDGIVLAIHSKGETVSIYLCGEADRYFSDKELNTIMNNVLSKLEYRQYVEAANSYFSDIENYIPGTEANKENLEAVESIVTVNNAVEEVPGDIDVINRILLGEDYFNRDRMLQCLFISFLAGIIFILFMLPKKEKIFTVDRSKYLENNTLSITGKEDNLVDTQLTFEDL